VEAVIGATQKRQSRLDRIEAQDIVQRYKEGYFGDDMTLLTVSASRAINFIETWLELNERGQMDQVGHQPVERPRTEGGR
jgi:RNA binding exosome subunit